MMLVLNSFINNRLMTKSKDCKLDLVKKQDVDDCPLCLRRICISCHVQIFLGSSFNGYAARGRPSRYENGSLTERDNVVVD